jgi:hypothetical protein
MKVQRIAGLDARLICGMDKFGGRSRLSWQDLLVSAARRDEIMEVLRNADLVHIHNRWTKQKLFHLWPEALAIVKAKPKVLQFHSPRDALLKDTPDSFALECPKLVVAQYQWRFYQDATPVPNVVPLDDAWHTPAWSVTKPTGTTAWSLDLGSSLPGSTDGSPYGKYTTGSLHDGRPLSVAFSPSNLTDRGWDNKGYRATRELLRKMPDIDHRIFVGMELPKLLLERKSAHVVIDEVMTGSYHMVSLEALAQGQVAIANLDSKTVDALELVTGTRRHPWTCCSLRELPDVLRQLQNDRRLLELRMLGSRRYIEKYWDPFRVTQLYQEAYKRA